MKVNLEYVFKDHQRDIRRHESTEQKKKIWNQNKENKE